MTELPGTNQVEGYMSPEWQAERTYTFEGQPVKGYPKAVARLTRDAMTLPSRETKQTFNPLRADRRAIVIMGPPAAGKSSIAGKIAYDSGAAIVDGDEAKKVIPEYANGAGAGRVHEESSDMGKAVLSQLAGRGVNLVIPKVGDTIESMQKVVDNLGAQGYSVEFVLQDVTPSTALERIAGRGVSTGRIIPSFVSENVGFKPQEVFRQLQEQGIGVGWTSLDGEVGKGEALPVKSTAGQSPVAGTALDAGEVSVQYGGRGDRRGEVRPTSGVTGGGPEGVGGTGPATAAGVDDSGLSNPENVRASAESIVERAKAVKGRGRPSPFVQGVRSGAITPEAVADGLADAINLDGFSLGGTLMQIGKTIYPEGSPQDQRNAALFALNDVEKDGNGYFDKETLQGRDKRSGKPTSFSNIVPNNALKKSFGMEIPERIRLREPMADPSDTSGAKAKPGNLLEGPALERAENTIRVQQANRYTLDKAYIDGLTWQDMVSAKGPKKYGEMRKQEAIKAQSKLARLKKAAEVHGDQEVGFQYTVDKKGRTYPNGEFHPQAGETIKGMFMVDGRSLKDMESVDHTGSGWQIAAIIARDEVIAPEVNIAPGQADQANPRKGDIYTAVMNAMNQRILSDAEAGVPAAQNYKAAVIDGMPEYKHRNVFKTPIIAVNYAGGEANFRDAFRDHYGAALGKQEPGFWSYLSGLAYNAVGDAAPATKAFKDWAVEGLKQAIEAHPNPSELVFTVGRDAPYSIVRTKKKKENVRALDKRPDSRIKEVQATETIDTGDIDPQATARNIFSQLIQGFDAAIMHDAVDKYKAADPDAFVTTNHDSYTVPPENTAQLSDAVREAMIDMMGDVDVPARLRQEILDQTGVDIGEFTGAGSLDVEGIRTALPVWKEGKDGGDDSSPYPTTAQAIDFAAQDVGPSGVQMDTSLPKASELAETNQFPTGRDFKVRLQEMALAAQDGQVDLRENSPEALERLLDFVVEDANAAAVNNMNAIGWYDRTVTEAKNTMAELYPEILTDPEAEFKFIWALAVTSNGLKVDKNFELAADAYDAMKANGSFPDKIGVGQAAKNIDVGLAMYDQLVDKLGGWEAARDFMVNRLPVRDIEKISGIKVSKEGKGTTLPGAVILGPKIGGGFFSNLYGNFDELTMDRWFTRTLGRWRGNLIEANPPMEAKKRAEIRETLRSLGPSDLKYLQGFFNGYDGPVRKVMSDDQVNALGNEIAKRSTDPGWRQRFSEAVGGNELRKVGNMLAKYLDGQKEDPGGAKDREFIRDLFRQGLEKLRANPDMADLTMADLQALLWYPEKRLYDSAKKKPGEEALGYEQDEAPDYANAARKLVTSRMGGSGPDGGPDGGGSGAEPSAGGAGPAAGEGARPTVAAGVDAPSWLDIGGEKKGGVREAMQGILQTAKNPLGYSRTKMEAVEDNFFNRFAPIRRLEMDTRGELGTGAESAFKAAENAVNDAGRNETLMFYGAAKLGQHGEFTTAAGTKGLREVFDIVADSVPPSEKGQAMTDWMGYMVARRIKELKDRGFTGTFPVSDAEIDQYLGKETSAFKEAANEWRKHNEANINFLVDTGRISKAQADAMKETEAYVPFYRSQQNSDGTSPELDISAVKKGPRAGGELLRRDPGIKALKGGDKKAFDNIMLNMIRNSQAMVAAGMRNDAANKTFDLMEDAGLAKTVKGKESKKPDKNAVAVWKDGKKKWVKLTDNDAEPLLVAMAGLQPLQLGRIQQLMAGVGSVFRQGITLSPAFMVRNAIRGAVATGLLSGGANLGVANNTLTGFREAYNNSGATRAFKAMSGMGDYRFGGVDVGLGKNDILAEYGLAPKTLGYRIRKAVDKAEEVGTATELADRVAMYKNLVDNGVRPDEAAYQARAVMDYSRKGGLPELRAWLPTVPFLNARLQGYSRLAEGGLDRKTGKGFGQLTRAQAMKNLALHGAVLMALSAALWARNAFDDERQEKYKQEPLHRRLNYHIVYVGDKTILIPKAFELGHIFSSIPELFGDAMVNDMNEIGPGLKKIVADTVAFNLIPAAAQPIIEGQANYSFFRGAPIEGRREQSLRAADRVQGSSALSRFIGQQLGISDATGLSPSMIEHYLQGYGGTYFLTAASAMDVATSEVGIGSAPVGGAFGDVPVVSSAIQRAFGSMLKETDQASSKYVEEFYNNKDYITQIYRSAKDAAANGDVEYAQKLLDKAGGTPAAYKIVNKASAQLGDINRAIREVRANKDLNPKQKRDMIGPMIKARNDLVRNVSNVIRQIEEKQGRTFKSAA